MTYLTKYADQPSAISARPELVRVADQTDVMQAAPAVPVKGGPKGAPVVLDAPTAPPDFDPSVAMIVTAYSVAPGIDKDGNPIPGVLASGTYVLEAKVVAELNGKPLQLPPGVAYITPIYFGMATPLPGPSL